MRRAVQRDLMPGGSSLCEQGQIFLVVAGGHYKKGAVHPGGIQRSQHLRGGLAGAVIKGQADPFFRQGRGSGRTGIGCSHRRRGRGKGAEVRRGGQLVQMPAQPPAARPIARCARRRAAQIASYTTNPSFALGAAPQAHFPRTNDLCNCLQGCFCARCAAIIDMKHKKTYEKQRNHLTNGRKYVTISKQSAPTVFYLKNRRTV